MIRLIVLLGAAILGLGCAPPPRAASPAPTSAEVGGAAPCRADGTTTADWHCLFPRSPGVLLVLDGVMAALDTTAASRPHRDSLLATLTNRVITRITMYPPGDTAAARWIGTRAQDGVVVIETRPF